MQALPTGTVTFLFTYIEGSTTLWQRHSAAMERVLPRHDQLLRKAIEAAHGQVVKSTGDGLYAVFEAPADALLAAAVAQRYCS